MYTLFFLFLLKNIDCGYPLEPPHRGGSNEYPQSMFRAELWKILEFLSEKFQFSKVKFSIYLNRRVFVMPISQWPWTGSICSCLWFSCDLVSDRHWAFSFVPSQCLRLFVFHCNVSLVQEQEWLWIRHWQYTLVVFTLSAKILFVCVEVLRPSQPNGVMSSSVSLPNHTFTGQA